MAEQDAGGDPGEDPVGQAEAEGLLVHQVADADHPGREADRDGDVPAGAEDHRRPGTDHGEAAWTTPSGMRKASTMLRASSRGLGERRSLPVVIARNGMSLPGDRGFEAVGDADPEQLGRCRSRRAGPAASDGGQRRVGVSAGPATGDDHAKLAQVLGAVDGRCHFSAPAIRMSSSAGKPIPARCQICGYCDAVVNPGKVLTSLTTGCGGVFGRPRSCVPARPRILRAGRSRPGAARDSRGCRGMPNTLRKGRFVTILQFGHKLSTTFGMSKLLA